MTDKLKVVAAIREALEAGPIAGPWRGTVFLDHDGPTECDEYNLQAAIGNAWENIASMDWWNKEAQPTREQAMRNLAYVVSVNPEAITTVLDALDAALERVKVLEANDRRYRWLRIYYTPVDSIDGVPDELDRAMMVGGNILDAAIDAAMEVKP